MDFLRFALQYAYSRRNAAFYILICCAVYLIVFLVRGMSTTVLAILILVSLAPIAFLETRRMLRYYQKRLTFGDIDELNEQVLDDLQTEYPPSDSLDDENYQTLLRRFVEASGGDDGDDASADGGLSAFYGRWAKEFKDSVSSMERLILTGDSPMVRRMSIELRRMERYAEMAAAYARLESGPGYALRRYDLSAIVQKAVSKFDSEWIEKKLSVTFEPTSVMAVTDGKWLLFALDQILSNALKHTFSGGVTIAIDKEAPELPDPDEGWRVASNGEASDLGPFLSIQDTGIGIVEETMQRLFDAPSEGGDAAQGGLGLYLCGRICAGLGHSILIASKEGAGTLVRLELSMGLAALDASEEKNSASEETTESDEEK